MDQAANVSSPPIDKPSLQASELFTEAKEEAKDVPEEAPEVHRESLLKDLKEALAEQERSKLTNAQLQHRIAEYLSRKKVCAICGGVVY